MVPAFEKRWVRVAAALVSGGLFYVSFGLTPIWWAAWLAPVPILAAAFYAGTWREASLLAYLAAAIGVSCNWSYYLKTTGALATPILMVLLVLLWGFFIVRTRAEVRRGRQWATVFVFPILITAASTLISFFSPHGTWGSYAYTQMDALPVIQIASVCGVPGVVFVVALFSSAVAVMLYRGLAVPAPWKMYGLAFGIVAAVLIFGFLRVRSAANAPTIRVGLAAVDDFISNRLPATQVSAVWDRYGVLVDELAKRGARVIVLPEKIEALSGGDMEMRKNELAAWARTAGVYLVAGVQLNRGARKDNASWFLGPSEGLMAEYHKQHMVPHLEGDLTPGNENMTEAIDGSRFGLAICRDLIFAGFGRGYGRLGVSAMLIPAWDFYVDAWMESNVTAMRGVENGFTIVRAGRESYLNVSDGYGRVIARKRSDFMPGESLIVDVPLGNGRPTFYSRFGDWFGWLTVVGLIFIVVRGRWRIDVPASEAAG